MKIAKLDTIILEHVQMLDNCHHIAKNFKEEISWIGCQKISEVTAWILMPSQSRG